METVTEPLYRLKAVERYFRVGSAEVRAVDNVDLELYPGELVAIEGPSGSGKSTMLQLLGALDKPSRGSVVFDGRDLSKLEDGELTSIRAREIGTILRSLAAEHGVTVILVTHADNVAAWAHRRLAMHDGQLSERDDSQWTAPGAPVPAVAGPTAEPPDPAS